MTNELHAFYFPALAQALFGYGKEEEKKNQRERERKRMREAEHTVRFFGKSALPGVPGCQTHDTETDCYLVDWTLGTKISATVYVYKYYRPSSICRGTYINGALFSLFSPFACDPP